MDEVLATRSLHAVRDIIDAVVAIWTDFEVQWSIMGGSLTVSGRPEVVLDKWPSPPAGRPLIYWWTCGTQGASPSQYGAIYGFNGASSRHLNGFWASQAGLG